MEQKGVVLVQIKYNRSLFLLMKRHSSLRRTAILYQKEATKPLPPQYSPSYKRVHKSKNFQMVVMNPYTKKMGSRTERKGRNGNFNMGVNNYNSEFNPEKGKSPLFSNVKDFKMNLSHKLKDQSQKFNSVRSLSQLQELKVKENRKIQERLRTQQREQLMQQIQFKRKEMQRDQHVRLRRTTSQRSFVLQSHKDTIEMLKHSRQSSSRNQLRFTKQRYRQTEKEHEFLTIKNRTSSLHQGYQQRYTKAFIKNAPMPKFKYPNLNDMLAIASKTITNNKKNEKIDTKHQKQNSRQKLTSIDPRQISKKAGHKQKKMQLLLQTPKKKANQVESAKEKIPNKDKQEDNPNIERQPSPFLEEQPQTNPQPQTNLNLQVQPQPVLNSEIQPKPETNPPTKEEPVPEPTPQQPPKPVQQSVIV